MLTTKIELQVGVGANGVPPAPAIVFEYLTNAKEANEQILEAFSDYITDGKTVVVTKTVNANTGKTTITLKPSTL